MESTSNTRPLLTSIVVGIGALVLCKVFGMGTGAALVIAIIFAAGAWFLLQSRNQERDADAAKAAATGTVQALKPEDVVGLDGRTWMVKGSVRFNEDGFTWNEHLLVDGDERRWLSVEEDEGEVEVVLWERSTSSTLEPGGDLIEHAGTSYRLDERGRASFTSEGSSGMPASGQMQYADYQAGDKRLGFEQYTTDGGWELCVGEVLTTHSLEVYPASAPAPA